jgi:uncharacterized iron-regulated membrane protein
MKKIGIYFLAFTIIGIVSCGRGQKKSQSAQEAETIEITAEPEAEAEALATEAGNQESTNQVQQMQQQQAQPASRPQETRPAAVAPKRPEAPVREAVKSDMERIRPAPDETIIAPPDTTKPKPGGIN